MVTMAKIDKWIDENIDELYAQFKKGPDAKSGISTPKRGLSSRSISPSNIRTKGKKATN